LILFSDRKSSLPVVVAAILVGAPNNIFFYSECGFDLFVDRELVIVDFHVIFASNFRRR
jgi:hypothetical protein